MANVTVTVSSAYEVRFTWDGRLKSMSEAGGGWTTTFETEAGTHLYCVTAWGNPGAAWETLVATVRARNHHSGYFSPGGTDTTGDTAIEA